MNNSRLQKKGIVVVLLIFVFLFLSTSIFWRFMFPVKYIEEIFVHAEQYDIDPYLVMAIIRVESKFVPDQTSKKGAIGLMQIMPETAKWAAT
ncbi:MAG: lytic transglycosylase domain-containing protein, partial [Bacilli bacterium]